MTVLLGFIPTEVGMRALDAAVQEADRRAMRLLALNVICEGREDDPRHATEGQLAFAEERIRATRLPYEIRQVTADSVPDVLLDVAQEERAVEIVIGVRKDRAVAGHLLGVTTRDILLGAICPVLTV